MKLKRLLGFGLQHLLALALVTLCGFCLLTGQARADGLSLGYASSDTGLKPGMVAALSNDSTSATPVVERGSSDNPDKIIGLATGVSDSLVVISPGKQQIYVQTSGDAMGYVADINGLVKKGDLLTISPLKGVMMKADASSTVILASALEDLNTQNAQSYTVQIKGGSKQAAVVKIGVNLDHKSVASGGSQLGPLATFGKAVTGRNISEVRVLIALVIFVLILVSEGGIIYGAVSSALTSIGRNPLATSTIRRELIRVLFVAAFVFIVGLASIYGVIRL